MSKRIWQAGFVAILIRNSMSEAVSNSLDSSTNCRNIQFAEFIRATYGARVEPPKRLPNISEQNSTFVLGCAKYTLVYGRVFHGTKLKCATLFWRKTGQRTTLIRPPQAESHLNNLHRGCAGRLPFCWQKRRNRRSQQSRTPVSFVWY